MSHSALCTTQSQHAAGGVCQMSVTKSMLSCAQGARHMYMAYLEAEKEKVLKQNVEQNFNSKRNHECEEAEKMEAKKRRLNQDIAAMLKSADELATSAELTGDLTLLAKSNAMRQTNRKH